MQGNDYAALSIAIALLISMIFLIAGLINELVPLVLGSLFFIVLFSIVLIKIVNDEQKSFKSMEVIEVGERHLCIESKCFIINVSVDEK